jgi:hypothetical protein
MKVLLLCFAIFFTMGCSTLGGVALDPLNISLYTIEKAVEASMPRGRRKISQNGREHYSNYFLRHNQKYIDASQMSQREYAKVVVLGDRRPYKIKVLVIKEKRISKPGAIQSEYSMAGTSLAHAKLVGKQILEILSKRQEDGNIIDDFRVF